ncbi:MAG: hypothetical protein SV765_08925 [Pseudomonadota bacterium]|nr:hypothetical protein [Pseudomonadota bacterium]
MIITAANGVTAGWGFDDLKKLVPVEKNQDTDTAKAEMEAEPASENLSAAETTAQETKARAEEAEAQARMSDLVEENERVIKRLIASMIRVAEAQANFAEALDAKDQADKLRAESKALGEANYTDKRALHRHVKISKATNKVIQERVKAKQELSKEGRKQFSTGLLHYVIAVKETKEMTDEVGPFYRATMAEVETIEGMIEQGKSQDNVIGLIKNVTGYAKSRFGKKFATTRYLMKNGKGLAKDHKLTVNSVVEYSRNNEIEVPPEVETSLDFI